MATGKEQNGFSGVIMRQVIGGGIYYLYLPEDGSKPFRNRIGDAQDRVDWDFWKRLYGDEGEHLDLDSGVNLLRTNEDGIADVTFVSDNPEVTIVHKTAKGLGARGFIKCVISKVENGESVPQAIKECS